MNPKVNNGLFATIKRATTNVAHSIVRHGRDIGNDIIGQYDSDVGHHLVKKAMAQHQLKTSYPAGFVAKHPTTGQQGVVTGHSDGHVHIAYRDGEVRVPSKDIENHFKHLHESDSLNEGLRLLTTTKREPLCESLRHVKTYDHETNGRTAKVYKDRDWDEHRVQFFENGVHQTEADYHTDDALDAHDTAKHYVNKGIVKPGGDNKFPGVFKESDESASQERLAHGFLAMHIAAHHAIDTLHKSGVISGQQALDMKSHPSVKQHLVDAKVFKSELTPEDYAQAAVHAKKHHGETVDHKYTHPDSMYFSSVAAR